MGWFRTRIRRWLGVTDLWERHYGLEAVVEKRFSELTSLSADVSVYGESQVILVSRLNGGIVKIYQAKFSGVSDVRDFMRFLEKRFGAKTNVMDVPRNDPRMRY